jgi:hypothetical protein
MNRRFLAITVGVCTIGTIGSAYAAPAANAAAGVQVGAATGWVDTGISVMAGDKLSITAAGSWTADGTNYTGPAGYSQTSPDNFLNLDDIGVCATCATAQTPHWGALIGYVGNNPPAPGSYTSASEFPLAQRVFAVGSSLQAITPETGELWLAMNDDAYSSHTQDNLGTVSASVSVSNNPPPGESLTQRILLYIYDPILANKGNQPLNVAYGWQDPVSLANQVAGDLEKSSHGIVHYDIVQTEVADAFPVFNDGFQYNATTWESDWANGTPHQCPDYNFCFDYRRFISDNNIVSRISTGDFDEVWIYADPMGGMAESTMAGDGAYWLNSVPVSGWNGSQAFVIMGWNYERGVGEALHSYGHRVESIMCHMYWPPPGGNCLGPYPTHSDNWGRFVTIDSESPGHGGVGRVHCPVNACESIDYDYHNMTYVASNADDWYNYPNTNFAGKTRQINALDWSPNNSDPQREYLNWWYSHIPHAPGRNPDRLLNDWWQYVINVDKYKFGDLPPETSITSGPSGISVSTSAAFDFSASEPQSTFACSLDGASFAPCTNPFFLSGLSQGPHTLKVLATDYAGNADPTPASWNWTIDTIAPTVPRVGGTGLAKPFSLSLRLPIRWTATDSGTGVANYDMRYRRAPYNADLGAARLWQDHAAGGSATFRGLAGSTYCFWARARDRAGLTSAWSAAKCTELPVDDRTLRVASGAWHRNSGSGYYLGTYTQSSARGAALRLTHVRARRVAIVATTCRTCGTIKLTLGTWHQTFRLYSPTSRKEQVLMSSEFGSLHTGTLTIGILSSGKTVKIDGLGVSRA